MANQPTSSAPHPSLPARPPPPANPVPSLPYGKNASGASYGSFSGFKPRSVAQPAGLNSGWQAAPTVSAPPTTYAPPQTGYVAGGYSYQQQPAYYAPAGIDPYAQPTPPQIQNPFAPPGPGVGYGRGSSTYDPETEAQIAQWQSAYAPKDEQRPHQKGRSDGASSAGNANNTPLGGRPPAHSTPDVTSHASNNTPAVGADGKPKTVIRSGGGQTWQDPTLLEWDPSHFRIFVGNLAGEVTDESLLKAFSRYPSVSKARVIRDKRTTKSKGYGFVSFANGDDMFQAAKEMQGKYIGSHPVLIKRSDTEIRPVVVTDKRNKGKNKKNNHNNSKVAGHANTGAGVQKKQPKIRDGLKILG